MPTLRPCLRCNRIIPTTTTRRCCPDGTNCHARYTRIINGDQHRKGRHGVPITAPAPAGFIIPDNPIDHLYRFSTAR
tara:strand:+ start:6513 stop:6743 length:231 start_codon:yes stop_codon:yes gene_type:complete